MRTLWLIRFDFPEGTLWAGWAGDQLGYAPTSDTAAEFPSQEIAKRHLANYHPEIATYGHLVPRGVQ